MQRVYIELKINLEAGEEDYIYLTFRDGTVQKLSRTEALEMIGVIQFKLENDEYS